MNELLYLFAVLQLFDAYTTHVILKHGGRELNPLMAKLFNEFGHLPVLLVLKAALVAVIGYMNDATVTLIVCAIYAVVVIYNIKNMRV